MLSNKIQLLSEEEKNNLVKILNTKYASFLNDRLFEIECNADKDLVSVEVTLRNSLDRLHYPVEGQLAFKQENLGPKDAALFLIDYIDFYFDEFFKGDEEIMLPIDWSKHTFEGKVFQVKGQIFNLERERLADEWLKKNN